MKASATVITHDACWGGAAACVLALCCLLLGLPAGKAPGAEFPPLAAAEMPVQLDLEAEWKAQFAQLQVEIGSRGRFEKIAAQAKRSESLILKEDRDPADIVSRRTEALLADLQRTPRGRDLAAAATQLAALKTRCRETDVKDAEARYAVFRTGCELRRRIALSNPLLDFNQILFVKRHRAKIDHMCDQFFGFKARPGGGVFILSDPFGPQPKVRDVLAGAACRGGRFDGKELTPGSFIAPDVSWDGRTILFAYTEGEPSEYKWTPKSTYHVFRVNADGTDLRQLTDGAWNDFDPCWMPDGNVVMISERRGGYGRCHGRPVPIFTLHTMKPDGSDIACLSYHESNEWQPSIGNDGMIVYTRWDYVDRGFSQAHHPWITSPDGHDARAIHGNYPKNVGTRPWMELDVRAIPNSNKFVATAAAHHSQAYGSLVLIDPDAEDDDSWGPVRRLTPDSVFPESEGGTKEMYATAWPLGEDYCLAAYDPGGRTYGLYLVDALGNKELLYRDPQIAVLSPMPLRPRRVPPLRPLAKPEAAAAKAGEEAEKAPEGTVALINVYDTIDNWPADARATHLRVIQVLPKSTPNANEPRIGYGSQKGARAVLGTVPVEPDGSAHFSLPAGKPVYFQALDRTGLAIQSMRSDVYVRQGERLTCQGCHERRWRAPSAPAEMPAALRRAPSRIVPDVDGSSPLSFPRLVQPVLDRQCVACHEKEKDKKALDLAGAPGGKYGWLKSYENLRNFAFFYDGDGITTSRSIPGKFGAAESKLLKLLAKGHYDVRLSPEDAHRVALWLDCNSDFYGAYENTAAQARGEVVRPKIE
jgi:hypothetical protein